MDKYIAFARAQLDELEESTRQDLDPICEALNIRVEEVNSYTFADIMAKRKILDELETLRHRVTSDTGIEEHIIRVAQLICEPFASDPEYPGARP